MEKLKDVKEIVLSGGPCSGKSTAIPYLIEELQNRGVRLFITPEIPTLIIPGGIPDIKEIGRKDPERLYKIQEQFLRAHLEFRSSCHAFAEIFPGEKRMILHDRGSVDGNPYVPFGLFWDMVAEHGLRPYDVMESYDGVIFLRSAARLGDGFYTTENNKGRVEKNREEAALLDEATLQAWIGHPHLTIIESCEDFSAKLRRVLQAVLRILGMPVPLEIERKFLLRGVPDFGIEALSGAQKVLIEQMYCVAPDGEEFRLRKRTFRNASVYYKTKKTVINSRVREEYETVISPLEYIRLQKFQESGTGSIRKERCYFVYSNQYFELDRFLDAEIVLLEAELTEENDAVDIPPFCGVVREVTDEPLWRNREIARRLGTK